MNTSRHKKQITLAELKSIMQEAQPHTTAKSKGALKKPSASLQKADKPIDQKHVNLAKEAEIQQEAAGRRQQRYQEAKALLAFLCEAHPQCFNFKFRKPLKVGIDKDILAKHPEKAANKAVLANALKIYTLNIRYWKAIINQEDRIDLEGNPDGKVTAEQKAHANIPYQKALANLAEHPRKDKKPYPKSKAAYSKKVKA
ncbi:MAG: ProQ activator of osmoprotectant transporter ProP [Gammaproteobacteria bacterium]|nr:ProQ activator of osmoprotectant transporter ProP [Gammaproteobacteria bacterium]